MGGKVSSGFSSVCISYFLLMSTVLNLVATCKKWFWKFRGHPRRIKTAGGNIQGDGLRGDSREFLSILVFNLELNHIEISVWRYQRIGRSDSWHSAVASPEYRQHGSSKRSATIFVSCPPLNRTFFQGTTTRWFCRGWKTRTNHTSAPLWSTRSRIICSFQEELGSGYLLGTRNSKGDRLSTSTLQLRDLRQDEG